METSSYGKKVLLNCVGAFCDALSTDAKKLSAIADKLIKLDDGNKDDTFLLARGIGYAVKAYQSFDPKENAARLEAIAGEIKVAEARDPSTEIMALMAAADDADKPSIIASFPVVAEEIAAALETLREEKNGLMLGAAIAFRDAWDSAVRFGEPRALSDGGSVVVKLDAGVYRITFKSHVYRLVFKASDDWTLLECNAKALTPVATYADVAAVDFLSDDKKPVITSATKARKYAKVAYTGYRGWKPTEAPSAMAAACNASFEALSAGNPTSANFCLVTDKVDDWIAQSAELTLLPTEKITPDK